MRTTITVIFFLLASITGLSFPKERAGNATKKTVTLFFHHQVGNEVLALGNSVKNILGETISIEKFKYYVSNFSVTDDKGTITKLPVQYFLVDEMDSASKKITLTIPDISIRSIGFLLGVDSIRNVSGIQTGALDPLKGMFWTWNSGYIMAKLEGMSDKSVSAGNRFTYHIGGFRKGMSTTKLIDLKIPATEKRATEIHIAADINHWFKSSSEIRISEIAVCHSPGPLAMKIADNYSTMFSINFIR
jgi:hypothetical protein